ncbi:TonB-dependent receptor [Novosphingobium aquimarinum]|uniref:TonB-dependent receptor n=1 Tax=Novosphingobium aquimarinum TaxID=2682494 RepID=UPI0012EB8D9B|nr:TonB-dependent receptor [Novosphingobium aquimarinum]
MRRIRSSLLITTVLAATFIASSAQAQEATPRERAASGSDEVIIVTAQKREQTLIDVPQSVSVVSGGALERNSAQTFQDYLKLVPGLQATQSNPGEARLTLRGINTGGVASTVATYIDETPFGSSTSLVNGAILAAEIDTFDIARIEVLRGPQGSLYGANALGGVLKYVTNEPDPDALEARVRGGVETVDGGKLSYLGSAVVNVPLGETFAVRATGFYRDMAGFIDSIGTAGSDVAKDINGYKSYGGRISALFEPSPMVSVRLSAFLQNLEGEAGNTIETDPLTLRKLNGRFTQSQYVPVFTDVDYRLYSGTVTADLGFADLTSVTSYGKLNETLRDDFTVFYGVQLGLYGDGPDRAVDIGLDQKNTIERFTQEVRLSNETDLLDWLVGGYYNKEDSGIHQRLDALVRGTLDVSDLLPQLADITLDSEYEEIAAFANATVHLAERFDLTFGGRYSHNKQSAEQIATGLLGAPPSASSSSEDVFTWSVAPQFEFSDNATLYARVAKGFRPGGPNLLPPDAPADTPRTFDSDSLVSYELGLKAQTPDRSFSIDITAFHIDWKDIQLLAVVNDYGVNANGGKAKSDGVEFTATMRPTQGFVASVNGAYTHARLAQDTPAVVGGFDGDRLPFTPKWSVATNVDYDWALGPDTDAYIGGSIRLVGDRAANFSPEFIAVNARQPELDGYATVDLRAGVIRGPFSVELYAKNLTNSAGRTDLSISSGYPALGEFPNGAVGAGVIRPRTFGITLGAGI